jgi:hypothetical protein
LGTWYVKRNTFLKHISKYNIETAHNYVTFFSGVSWFLITLHAAFYNIDAILCPGEAELNALVMQEV